MSEITVTITIKDQSVIDMIEDNKREYDCDNESAVLDLLFDWANHYCDDH